LEVEAVKQELELLLEVLELQALEQYLAQQVLEAVALEVVVALE
jgi:hypothetical protein